MQPRRGRTRKFLSTPSARRATSGFQCRCPYPSDFYPRPLRGGRQCHGTDHHPHLPISIHALCEEGDLPVLNLYCLLLNFYPRPLRGGRRLPNTTELAGMAFLSTPSARRATASIWPGTASWTISIHALCEEGDHDALTRRRPGQYFYPRPLRGGRRTGQVFAVKPFDFYPRPLRGGRPPETVPKRDTETFLSTPSARRAT